MMKIRKSDYYYVERFDEPGNKYQHTKIPIQPLWFSGKELIDAIISAGMPAVYLSKKVIRNRQEEIKFKIQLFETFVLSKNGKLSFDSARKVYLDSSEVGAINYWIGMILITVLGQQVYGYNFMVHLSMIKNNSKYIFKYNPNYNPQSLFPDLLAIDSSRGRYGIFESKGRGKYDKNAMEHGYDQVKSVTSVNGKLLANCLVVMTKINNKCIQMIEKDPESDGYDINIDPVDLHIYHFLPIIELIKELGTEEKDGRTYGTLNYNEENYKISVPTILYNKISGILDSDELSWEDLHEIIFSKIFRNNYLSNEQLLESGILGEMFSFKCA